jgi:hypothetical protein
MHELSANSRAAKILNHLKPACATELQPLPDANHLYVRQVGQIHSMRPGEDDNKSLRQLKFQTGDFLDVAVF